MVARLRLRKEQKPSAAQPETAQETLKVQRLRRLTALLKSNSSSYDPPPPPISSHPTPPNEIFAGDKHSHCDDVSLVTMSTWASYTTMRTLPLQQEADAEQTIERVDEMEQAKPFRGDVKKVVETIPATTEADLKPVARKINEQLKPVPGKIVGTSPPQEMIVRILPIGERSNSGIQNYRQEEEEEKQREVDDLMESCVRAAFQTAIDEAEKLQAPPAVNKSSPVVTTEIVSYSQSPCNSVASVPTTATAGTRSLTKSQLASGALFKRILRWMVVYGGSHQKDASKRLLEKAESLGPVQPGHSAAGNSFWKLHPDVMLDPGWRVMQDMLDAAGIDITDKASLEVFFQSHPPPPFPAKKTRQQKQPDPFDEPLLEDPFLDDFINYCTEDICRGAMMTRGRTV